MQRYRVVLCTILACLYHYTNAQVVLTGSGTAPALLVHNMLLAFYATDDGTTIKYTEQLYPTPKQQFLNGSIDFFVAVQSLSDAEHTPGACCQCDDIRAVPIVVSGWVFIHNMGGHFGASTVQLNLTRDQIVEIYLGSITNWSKINPSYPNATINVAYQPCNGGIDTITAAFAQMSSAWPASNVCPDATFPVGTGFSEHQQVLEYVMATPNSIGYLSAAAYTFGVRDPAKTRQTVGFVNKAGNTVLPTAETFYAASLDYADTVSESVLGVVGYLVDAPGPLSWPFSHYEYVTMRSRSNDCGKLAKLFGFIVWVISAREILSDQLEPAGIAILPPVTNDKVVAMLDDFVCCTSQTITPVNTAGTVFGHSTFLDLTSSRIYGYTPLADSIITSSAAITEVSAGTIDAALSTIYPSENTSNVMAVRLFGAAIVCAANIGLSENSSFVLDGATLAAIFEKTITSWSNSAITALNPSLQSQLTGSISLLDLPDSDTRAIFNQALSNFSSSYTGKNLPPALNQGIAQGVLTNVSLNSGSIGCFQYSVGLAANEVTFISLKNAAGNVIAAPPTPNNIMAAMNDFASTSNAVLANGHGSDSWPICAYDYFILNINENLGRCAQMTALAQLVVWVYTTTEAQSMVLADGLSYPPSSVRSAEQSKFVGLTCNDVALTPYVEDIYGVGASFPLLVYQSWPLFFATLPDPVTNDTSVTVRVSYSITGEFDGVEYFNSHLGEVFAEKALAHFGATDISTPIDPSFNLTKFPTLAGSIALVFNLGTIQQLNITRSVIVQIYTGVITMWNDPKLQALNSVTLPSAPIILVYRTSGSGSTYILKKALSSFSSSTAEWTGDVSADSTWPYNTTATYADNSYDASTVVATTAYSLGYVEYSYAVFTNLPVLAVQNQFGNYVLPGQDTITSAMNDFPLAKGKLVMDLVDGPGANSYPLAAYTYILVNQSWPDCDTSTRVLTFLDWCLNAAGPRARAQSFDLVPLPESTIELVEDQLRTLTCSQNKLPALPSIAIGCDGVIGSGIVNDSCGVCGGKNDTCCLGTSEQVAMYCFKCDYFHGHVPYVLNSYKCDGFLDCTGAEDDLHCKVSIVKTSIVLSAIAGICIVLCFAVGIDLFINRNEKIFKESNVFFMMMILTGVIIGYSAIFVFSQLTKLNDFVCGVQYWFFSVAFVFTFGSMIAKTYQVYMLHRQHSGDLSAYTNQAIVRYVAAAFLVEIIILIIWTAFDRPIPVLRHNDPSESTKEHLICGNKHFAVFAILLALFFGLILVSGVVLSFLSRDIDFEGNESRLIRRTILSAALLAVVILPILISLGSSFPFVRILLSNIALLLIASLIMITYFGPKLTQFHFGGESGYKDLKSKKRLVGPIDI